MPRPSFATASAELAKRDRVMRALLKRFGPCRIARSKESHFHSLAESIVYQQLAGRAAAAIFGRFQALFDGDMTPEAVLAAPDKALRGAGLSPNKMAAIRDLASHVADGRLPLDHVARLKDEALIEKLVGVRGIGRWTAEMFLMFQLRRPDVWPVDDYGVRKGYANAYGLPELPKPKELFALGERFRPYRTTAAWYCWRAVETVTPGGRSTKN
ncbi:MAG: DNA-3-methyladenine glycosylase 2 family protein [Actinobacteria bacterium]|nr:MAG: DNA-3-methyladenine glycosylase 2 family protein [Actinomycetota bacterium]